MLVGVGDRIVYQKAIGNRALVPSPEPMTLDTIFDLASLTKVVATTTSVMMLIEQGKLRLDDRVATFIPGFERYGKADITIRHLLTHVSGCGPTSISATCGPATDTAIALAIEEVPTAPPGDRFVYSDINFFLLGEIVGASAAAARSSSPGARLQAARHEGHDVQSAGVADAADRADRELHAVRLAVRRPGRAMLRGVVHDPTARRMGGVAGHAGLFSTAADLAIFCRMLLDGGGASRRADPLAADRGEDDDAGARPARTQRARARLGHRLVVSRATAASCCRSDRSGTPGSPARRSGSIRPRGCSSSSCPTACIPTARGTSRRCARGWRRSPRRRSSRAGRTAHAPLTPAAISAPRSCRRGAARARRR